MHYLSYARKTEMNETYCRYEGERPAQGTMNAAGYDLTSTHDVTIPVGKWKLVKTGLRTQFVANRMAQVCSRSGLALKHGIFVLNAPGIIDADYEGEIGVILCNLGEREYEVKKGDRIAQLVFLKVEHPLWMKGIEYGSVRGEGGFGSTGGI